jgi:hypothetical protein
VEYELVKNGTNEKVLDFSQKVSEIPDASPAQTTIEYMYPLKDLAPGQYTLRVKVKDKDNNPVLTPSAQFTVT